jgi:hypothetical protein
LEQDADNPVPWLVFEPAVAVTPAAAAAATSQLPLVEEIGTPQVTPAPAWLDDAGIQIMHATRSWIQYGTVGFAVICIVIGAVEALFGR